MSHNRTKYTEPSTAPRSVDQPLVVIGASHLMHLHPTHLVDEDGHVALELDGAVAGALLPFPAVPTGDDADAVLLARRHDHPPGLPPLVVARVHHVQDVAVVEGQPPAGKAVVPVGVVVEHGPGEDRQVPVRAGPRSSSQPITARAAVTPSDHSCLPNVEGTLLGRPEQRSGRRRLLRHVLLELVDLGFEAVVLLGPELHHQRDRVARTLQGKR